MWTQQSRPSTPSKETVMASAQGLETYLNDHLAGAAGGSELANKISSEYAGTQFGPFLAELARDIDQDKATLEELMERLGNQESVIKQGGSWVAEKVSKLQLGDRITRDQDQK